MHGTPAWRSRCTAAAALAVAAALAACATGSGPAAPAVAPSPAAPPAATVVPHREWAEAILYFAVVDRFADGDPANNRDVQPGEKGAFHGGDLAGLAGRLDDLAELGATALWITPVVKNIDGFVTGAGFPDWAYHGYWADDFTRLDPRFGSEEELKALVEAAHARGIEVLLDVVYNHAGYDSRYLTDPQTRGWLRSEAKGTCGSDDLTSCLAGLPDFRTELPAVADYLLAAHLGLAARVGLDGFRLDTVKHVDHPFWQEHRRRVRQELSPGFFLLGEVWGGDAQVLDPWFAGDELDAGFDFGFQGSVVAFLGGRGRAVAFDRYLKSRETVRPGHHLAHFLSSHDTPGALYQLQGDKERFRLALVLQMTAVGIPVVYYGEEVGRPGGDWPDNRSDMPWGGLGIAPGAGLPRDEALPRDYRRLIAARRAHPALWRGGHESLSVAGDLLVFARRDAASGDAVVVAINRGAEPVEARFPAPAEWSGRPVEDLWRAAPVAIEGGVGRAMVPALGAGVYASSHPNGWGQAPAPGRRIPLPAETAGRPGRGD
jgi:alpha-amylase